jgi:hypothetical protein
MRFLASFAHISSVHVMSQLLIYVTIYHGSLPMSHVLPPVPLIIVYPQVEPRFHNTVIVKSSSIFYINTTNCIIMSKTRLDSFLPKGILDLEMQLNLKQVN